MKKSRLIVNNDFYNIFQVQPPVTDQDIYNAVDRIAHSQVDTLCLMIPAHLQAQEAGLRPDLLRLYNHPQADPCIDSLYACLKAGKDPFRMVLSRARQKKMEVYGSIRMNDTHYLDQIYNPWVSPFYYDNLHNRVGTPNGRANTEFDYRKSVIRDHLRNRIAQAVADYDLDGIELDCTRNCKFFPAGDSHTGSASECAPVFTEFMLHIRELLKTAAKKRKHPIALSVVIPGSLYQARQEGLDIPVWADLGLIDRVCFSSPFIADFDRDITDARRKLPGVQIYAGCDRNCQWPGRPVPKETYRAMALTYLREAADGIYLYNVMDWTMDLDRLPDAVKGDGGQAPTCHSLSLIHELGDLETLETLDKLYLMSQDSERPDKPLAALPVTVPAGAEITLRMTVGDDIARFRKDQRIASIELQTISSDCADYNNYTLKLNGVDLSRQYAFQPHAVKPPNALLFPEPDRSLPVPPPEYVRRHPVRPIDLHMGVNFITIKSWKDPLTITGVELAIRYRNGSDPSSGTG